jgi:hypothetical protein
MLRALLRRTAPAALCLLLAPAAGAVAIASHVGMTDPGSEGWAVNAPIAIPAGPIDDGGTPAWFVNDNSAANGSTRIYSQTPSDADIALGNAMGWVLHVVLRVPSSDETDDGTIFAAYRDGAKSWQMNFGHDAQGDTVVKLFTNTSGSLDGPTFTVAGNDAYNEYRLVYDPVAMTADLFVNGSEEISDYGGLPGAQVGNAKEILWGAGRSVIQGEGRFNEVSLRIPEPAAAPLLALGALALAQPGRRRP